MGKAVLCTQNHLRNIAGRTELFCLFQLHLQAFYKSIRNLKIVLAGNCFWIYRFSKKIVLLIAGHIGFVLWIEPHKQNAPTHTNGLYDLVVTGFVGFCAFLFPVPKPLRFIPQDKVFEVRALFGLLFKPISDFSITKGKLGSKSHDFAAIFVILFFSFLIVRHLASPCSFFSAVCWCSCCAIPFLSVTVRSSS